MEKSPGQQFGVHLQEVSTKGRFLQVEIWLYYQAVTFSAWHALFTKQRVLCLITVTFRFFLCNMFWSLGLYLTWNHLVCYLFFGGEGEGVGEIGWKWSDACRVLQEPRLSNEYQPSLICYTWSNMLRLTVSTNGSDHFWEWPFSDIVCHRCFPTSIIDVGKQRWHTM